MATSIQRNQPKPDRSPPPRRRARAREIMICAGRTRVRARLLDTPTADRLWRTLPIYTTAETWGEAVHFETRVETGREPAARQNVKPGEIAFWSEDDRVIIGFGPTPLSKPGEIRLPLPCNVFAIALDDVAVLKAVRPGERVAVLEADS